MQIRCIPGIPIKRENPCIDPSQNILPHIIPVMYIDKNGNEIKTVLEANEKDYPEYTWLINKFLEEGK